MAQSRWETGINTEHQGKVYYQQKEYKDEMYSCKPAEHLSIVGQHV